MSKQEKPEEANDNGITVPGSMDITSGDFVGRDKGVFLGRDNPAQQEINIGDIKNSTVAIYPDTTIGRIGSQIDRLRGRVTRLIPAEDALKNLLNLREPKRINGFVLEEIALSVKVFNASLSQKFRKQSVDKFSNAKQYLEQLNEIEAVVVPNIEPEKYSQLLQTLSNITDEINIRIARFNSLFTSIVYPSKTSREFAENMVAKIGHKEFQDEANMHLDVISDFVHSMDSKKLTSPDFDVLSDEAYGAIGLMTELEKRRLVVEGLVRSDRIRRNRTVSLVVFYICLVIGLAIYSVLQWGIQFPFGQTQLNELRIPVFGIPWPVLVWSLVGSFASMIYRFNANPIFDFTDAIKWMITRPVQGVVFGSTLYLILVFAFRFFMNPWNVMLNGSYT